MIHELAPGEEQLLQPMTQDEKPFQRRRRLLMGLIALGIFMLGLFLELHLREIEPGELLSGIIDTFIFIIDPAAPRPSIDPASVFLGFIAVLRNTIPALVMFWLVLWFGEQFTQAVYGLSNRQEASQYLRDSLFGSVIGFGPYPVKLLTTLSLESGLGNLTGPRPMLIVQEGKILGGEYQPAARIGGPATLVISNDSAVLLEQAGRLTRVLGPGFHPLWRFEKIRAIADLRPRSHQCTVEGMSREGIPVRWTIDLHFQINDAGKGRHEPTKDCPFAYSEDAVFKAATDYWVCEADRTDHLDWGKRLLAEAEAELRNIMARYPLDALIMPGSAQVSPPRQAIQRELEAAVRNSTAKHGAKLLGVALRNVELMDPVAQQWVETWKARWKSSQRRVLAEGKAHRVRAIEDAKAKAKQEMISAISQGFKTLVDSGKPIRSEIILMRFTETMRRLFSAPTWAFPFTTQSLQAIESLLRMRNWLESNPPGSATGQLPQPPSPQLPPESVSPTEPSQRPPSETVPPTDQTPRPEPRPEPALPSAPWPPESLRGRAFYLNLLTKLGGDADAAKRLVESERALAPDASIEELLENAIDRWDRDNR